MFFGLAGAAALAGNELVGGQLFAEERRAQSLQQFNNRQQSLSPQQRQLHQHSLQQYYLSAGTQHNTTAALATAAAEAQQAQHTLGQRRRAWRYFSVCAVVFFAVLTALIFVVRT